MRSTEPRTGDGRSGTAKNHPRTGTVRIATIAAIPEVLRSLGADPAEVLKDAGVDPALFDDPDNRISHAARGRLLGHCVARTGCRHFGLLVGQQVRLHDFGLVGLLVKYSPDVGTALRSLVRFFHLHNRGATVDLAIDGSRTTLGYDAWQMHVDAAEQVGDGTVAAMLNIMRDLCGGGFTPLEAGFAHRRPEAVEPFRRFFAAPLRFDAERYGLVFSTNWLERALPYDDPEVRRLLQRQIDALEAAHGDDFAAQVRSVLRSALLTGDAGADRVAALFSMHSRTLNRHLHACGTTFRRLVDEIRFEIGRQMLESSSADVGRIADMLGYADASAFTRAFRRWSGTTPSHWRMARVHRVPRRR